VRALQIPAKWLPEAMHMSAKTTNSSKRGLPMASTGDTLQIVTNIAPQWFPRAMQKKSEHYK
jgi:hypothetical protein